MARTVFDSLLKSGYFRWVLQRYLQPGPYRFGMQFERGTFQEFFSPSAEHQEIITERQFWLDQNPQRYLAYLPESDPYLEELFQIGLKHKLLPPSLSRYGGAPELVQSLGRSWEPDFLVLNPAGGIRLVAGCVCFPSSWALEDKIGKPMSEIHGVVPGLNPAIGRQIEGFLTRLKPDNVWLRNNWGLSRSPERNQHPARALPRLDDHVSLQEVFFRVEEQALLRLPKTQAVLFGIRVKSFPLSELRADQSAAQAFKESLASMPEELAVYKGLANARGRIRKLLEL